MILLRRKELEDSAALIANRRDDAIWNIHFAKNVIGNKSLMATTIRKDDNYTGVTLIKDMLQMKP